MGRRTSDLKLFEVIKSTRPRSLNPTSVALRLFSKFCARAAGKGVLTVLSYLRNEKENLRVQQHIML